MKGHHIGFTLLEYGKVFINLLFILFSSGYAQDLNPSQEKVIFVEESHLLGLEDRCRRKFDNAVIADLDQNGYLDLLLTEHGRQVELLWNDKGKFLKADPFIFGDTHGIGIADYDLDGKMDVLIQPGGGDGKNPRKIIHYKVSKDRTIEKGNDFAHFKSSRGRAVKFVDVNQDGSLDLITSAFPSLEKLSEGNALYMRDSKLEFKFKKFLPHADRIGMRTTLTDFNNDNITDIIFHGGKKLVAVQGIRQGGFKEVTHEIFGELAKINLVHSISQIDFDNDGDFDLFLTRSKHPFDSEINYNEKEKNLYFFARRKDFKFDSLKIKGNLEIVNLQMAFPHFDINVGKEKQLWKRKKDKHGHHDLVLTPKEANGFPEDISKKGLYIGYLGNGYWRISGHTNSPTSMVIRNVISKPKTINLKPLPARLLENRDGKYIDATQDLGIQIKEQTSSAAIGDFNNDGYQDIFILRYGNPAYKTRQILLLNKKGKSFIKDHTSSIVSEELGSTGMGAETFDYDKDGDVDIIFSNERGRWHLFTNKSTNNNNYIAINIGNSPKGKASAMGAILSFTACGNTYKRRVGDTSSSYSHSLNTLLNIGLGDCTQITNAKVTWSNGEEIILNINKVNSTITTYDKSR